jgi:sulfopyruvate decarboxylase subunit alpha
MTARKIAGEPHRPSDLLDALRGLGVQMAVSVPDSWLGEILIRIDQDPAMSLIRATHEEEALAIACGARLGGLRPVLMIQNVGLLTIGAGMVSLAMRFQFPLLILASYRGTKEDAIFYHIPKARVTEPVLRGYGLSHALADPKRPIGEQVVQAATYAEESSNPFVLLLSKADIQW